MSKLQTPSAEFTPKPLDGLSIQLDFIQGKDFICPPVVGIRNGTADLPHITTFLINPYKKDQYGQIGDNDSEQVTQAQDPRSNPGDQHEGRLLRVRDKQWSSTVTSFRIMLSLSLCVIIRLLLRRGVMISHPLQQSFCPAGNFPGPQFIKPFPAGHVNRKR